MSKDLEPLLCELEAITARMIATTCWESGEFGELLAARGALVSRLTDRKDLDATAAGRIGVVIQAGEVIAVQILAMRESILAAIAETETERRFTQELARTVAGPVESHSVDMNA